MQRLTSLCYSLVYAPPLCFRVCCGSVERRQWTVYRELLAVKDHLIEIIKPHLIELLHIFVEAAQGDHIVLMKNSSASDGEPDIMSPSLNWR